MKKIYRWIVSGFCLLMITILIAACGAPALSSSPGEKPYDAFLTAKAAEGSPVPGDGTLVPPATEEPGVGTPRPEFVTTLMPGSGASSPNEEKSGPSQAEIDANNARACGLTLENQSAPVVMGKPTKLHLKFGTDVESCQIVGDSRVFSNEGTDVVFEYTFTNSGSVIVYLNCVHDWDGAKSTSSLPVDVEPSTQP